MTHIVAERRRSTRIGASYDVFFHDRRGRSLGHGRTVDISESGVYVLANMRDVPPADGLLRLTIHVPAHCESPRGRPLFRKVSYLCRVARSHRVSSMVGMGLEFIRKLA